LFQRTLTASNLHVSLQIPQRMQRFVSITWGFFFSPLMQLFGHCRAQLVHPVHNAVSMA